jgi:hypothetical protein
MIHRASGLTQPESQNEAVIEHLPGSLAFVLFLQSQQDQSQVLSSYLVIRGGPASSQASRRRPLAERL